MREKKQKEIAHNMIPDKNGMNKKYFIHILNGFKWCGLMNEWKLESSNLTTHPVDCFLLSLFLILCFYHFYFFLSFFFILFSLCWRLHPEFYDSCQMNDSKKCEFGTNTMWWIVETILLIFSTCIFHIWQDRKNRRRKKEEEERKKVETFTSSRSSSRWSSSLSLS